MTITVFASVTGYTVVLGTYNYFLPSTHSIFPLPSASTSADFGSLPIQMTQTFIPGPLVLDWVVVFHWL